MWITPNKANLSIIGAYNYDSTLFDNLQLPDDVERETVVSNILDYCAELELLYPDLPYLKNAIGYWSAKELPYWEKIREMETAKYNPIENYDRYDTEVESTDRAHDKNSNNAITGKTTNSAKSADVENGLNRDMVAGYNSDTLVVNGETRSNSTTNSTADAETKAETVQLNTEKDNENENRVKSLHSHGNIGVTTVAQMMQEMVEVLPSVNTISVICESFKRRFCLLVY